MLSNAYFINFPRFPCWGKDALGWVNSLCTHISQVTSHLMITDTVTLLKAWESTSPAIRVGLGATQSMSSESWGGKGANTEHISAQHGVRCSDLMHCHMGLLKDSTCYLTGSTAVTLGEFPGHGCLSWGEAALCGSTSQGCMPLQASAVQTCPNWALLHRRRNFNQSPAAATSGPTAQAQPCCTGHLIAPCCQQCHCSTSVWWKLSISWGTGCTNV